MDDLTGCTVKELERNLESLNESIEEAESNLFDLKRELDAVEAELARRRLAATADTTITTERVDT